MKPKTNVIPMYDLLTEISQEADMRNCIIEADTWEKGTERRW